MGGLPLSVASVNAAPDLRKLSTVMLATDDKKIAANFQNFTDWERLSFTRPIIVDSCDAAAAALSTEFIDAVAISLPTKESAKLHDRLHGMHMLFLEPVADAAALEGVLTRMALMIEKQREPSPAGTVLASIRDTFFNTLLDGLIHSEIVLRNRMQVIQLPISPDSPCVLYSLAMNGADHYLSDVWMYGRARLQLALRKFLAGEADGLYLSIGSIRAGAIRLICCPMGGVFTEGTEELVMCSKKIVEKRIADIADYLGLDLTVESMRLLGGLTALLSKV